MANSVALFSAFCIVAFAAVVHGHQKEVFHVEGDVYCDPCRVQFETRLSEKLSGATVRLVCTDLSTKAETYRVEGVTNCDGHYSLSVSGDHENDNCEVTVVKSPRSDCSDPMNDVLKSRVVCTENSGMHAGVRFANPIGFMTRNPLAQCAEVIKELGLTVDLHF